MRKLREELLLRLGQLLAQPGRELAIGVAADEDHLVRPQPFQALARKRAGCDIAAADDRVHAGRRNLREHGLERGQVAVYVVERCDPHR